LKNVATDIMKVYFAAVVTIPPNKYT